MSQKVEILKNIAVSVIESVQSFSNSKETITTYRTDPKHFCRSGKLSFSMTSSLLLSNMSNSTAVELYKNLKINNLIQFKSSSFCKNRYKIKASFFEKINAIAIALIYKMGKDVLKTWHGFTLRAIDGTTFQLPNKADIIAEFGTHKNGSSNGVITHTPMARCLVEEDVLNKIFTRVELYPIAKSELSASYDWLLNPSKLTDLTLFDRNFGNFLTMYLLNTANKEFVIRLKVGANNVVKEFVRSGLVDEIVTFRAERGINYDKISVSAGTEMRVRLVRIILPNGEIEILATSLFNQTEYLTAEFGALYNLRWGIETAIDVLKNKFEITSFLAHKAQGIYQEVYATIFDFNIQQLLVESAQLIVNENIAEKKNTKNGIKYEQKINNNVTIGILKFDFLSLWLSKSVSFFIDILVETFTKYTVPIRLNRSFIRKKGASKRKSMVTYTNFRRAG